MKKPRNRNLSRKKIVLMTSGTILIGFLVWLTIRVLTMEAKLELIQKYELPEFSSLENLYTPDNENYAVAIDDDLVAGNLENEVRPTASTAKMILGLAIMREKPFNNGEKGETITITPEMFNRYLWYLRNNGSNSKVLLGEEISEYDALVSVFLASSNNMADSLAIWAFGSLDAYKEYASKMLAEWGITNTTIGTDASGFDPSTTSTANDLAKIGHLVLENAVLKEIVGLKEYEVPVAGLLTNTNKILGMNRIIGIKTGYIGDVSGYCLIAGYMEGEHTVTTSLLGAPTRAQSFNDSLEIVAGVQNAAKETTVITAGQVVGYYDSWWTGLVEIRASEDLKVIGWQSADKNIELKMSEETLDEGTLKIKIGSYEYEVIVNTEEFAKEPTLGEKIAHSFGWKKESVTRESNEETEDAPVAETTETEPVVAEKFEEAPVANNDQSSAVTKVPSGNCTIKYGYLMLINPNFTVDTNFIDARKSELVSVLSLYGIVEGNSYNGDNLLDAEAAAHLNEMVKAYEKEYPGHTFETRSCYRARGTTCGRLCAATGTSDHHTGLTCDLLDPAYGTSLDTDTYSQHIDWQWLRANSYRYGFIDRFPEAWAGGPMSAPINVDENGSTGLFETWHYRYVGVGPATEIATGKYNNGNYDSLEHYLKARGMVTDLKLGKCE